MEFEWDKKKLPEFRCNLPQKHMWLAQFISAPQFFKTPIALCGHPVRLSGDNGI
jgi:hypothetical protein